jgi:hypothetical protein
VIRILVGTKFKSVGWKIMVSILGRVKIFFPGFLPQEEALDIKLGGFQRQSEGFGEESNVLPFGRGKVFFLCC